MPASSTMLWFLFDFNNGKGTAWFDDVFLCSQSGSGLNLTYTQVDASNFPIIDSYVTVTDDQGFPIFGLNASNFTVQEDGYTESPVTVTSVGCLAEPISVVLAIDRSGSMDGQPLIDAKNAAITFVNEIGPDEMDVLPCMMP